MGKRAALFLACVIAAASTAFPSHASSGNTKPKFNIKKLDMTLGNNFTLKVYNMKKNWRAVYTSSDPALVSIDKISQNTKTATLHANAIGSVTIQASIAKKKRTITLKCRVSVTPQAVSIKFIKQKIKLRTNEKKTAETIIKPFSSTELPIFESDNPDVASVNPFGIITAHNPGTAVVTATLLSTNQNATCTVVVLPYYNNSHNQPQKNDTPSPS